MPVASSASDRCAAAGTDDLARALDSLPKSGRARCLIVDARMVGFARCCGRGHSRRIACIAGWPSTSPRALASYAPDSARRFAGPFYVDRSCARQAAELPVAQPTKFELVVNSGPRRQSHHVPNACCCARRGDPMKRRAFLLAAGALGIPSAQGQSSNPPGSGPYWQLACQIVEGLRAGAKRAGPAEGKTSCSTFSTRTRIRSDEGGGASLRARAGRLIYAASEHGSGCRNGRTSKVRSSLAGALTRFALGLIA